MSVLDRILNALDYHPGVNIVFGGKFAYRSPEGFTANHAGQTAGNKYTHCFRIGLDNIADARALIDDHCNIIDRKHKKSIQKIYGKCQKYIITAIILTVKNLLKTLLRGPNIRILTSIDILLMFINEDNRFEYDILLWLWHII